MGKANAQKNLQKLAAEINEIVDRMTVIAQTNGITSVEVLGGRLLFGVQFEKSKYSKEGMVRHLDGYYPAKGGALYAEWEWNPSHFECNPQEEERTWLFGKDRASWPKTDYEDDD